MIKPAWKRHGKNTTKGYLIKIINKKESDREKRNIFYSPNQSSKDSICNHYITKKKIHCGL